MPDQPRGHGNASGAPDAGTRSPGRFGKDGIGGWTAGPGPSAGRREWESRTEPTAMRRLPSGDDRPASPRRPAQGPDAECGRLEIRQARAPCAERPEGARFGGDAVEAGRRHGTRLQDEDTTERAGDRRIQLLPKEGPLLSRQVPVSHRLPIDDRRSSARSNAATRGYGPFDGIVNSDDRRPSPRSGRPYPPRCVSRQASSCVKANRSYRDMPFARDDRRPGRC